MDRNYKLALQIIFTIFFLVAAVWFLREIHWVINITLVSILITYSISPGVTLLEKKKFPHWLAVILVFIAFLMLLGLMIYLVVPIIISEILELTQVLPQYFLIIQPHIFELMQYVQNPDFEEVLSTIIRQVPSNLQQLFNQVTALTLSLLSRLSELLIILFLVFFLLKDLSNIRSGIIKTLPLPYRHEFARVMGVIDDKVGAYLRGNFLRCGVVGVLTGTGLLIIGMPFYFVLGFVAGILNIIPYIGPNMAAIPAILISISPEAPGILLIIFFYLIVQSVDAFILTPFLLGKAVDIKPFTIIVSILIGGRIFGILGIILAIPFAATLKVLFSIYLNNSNSDKYQL